MRAALLVVLTAFLAACGTVSPVLPLAHDDPRPAALLAQWLAGAQGRTALRGRIHLAVDGDVRVRGNQIVVLQRPARLRVEVQGFLNQTAAVIATDGERFEVFRSDDGSYESGVVRPDLLWREARLALTPEEAVAVLLGVPILGEALVPARAALFENDRIRMDLVTPDQSVRQRAAFDASAQLREIVALDDAGAVRWQARFDDYALVDGEALAHSIVLDVVEGAAHIEMTLSDVELNPVLDPRVFRLRGAPAGAVPEGERG